MLLGGWAKEAEKISLSQTMTLNGAVSQTVWLDNSRCGCVQSQTRLIKNYSQQQ